MEITIQTADLSQAQSYFADYLYDGQTEQLLASVTTKDGKKSGMSYGIWDKSAVGWDETTGLIQSFMSDDRKQ